MSSKRMMGQIHYTGVWVYMPRDHALWVQANFRIFLQIELEDSLKLHKPIYVLHTGEFVHSSLGRLETDNGSCHAPSINPFHLSMTGIVW